VQHEKQKVFFMLAFLKPFEDLNDETGKGFWRKIIFQNR